MIKYKSLMLIIVFALMSNLKLNAEQLRKIYDCFLFFNEVDLLELRLEELYNKVDKFVLVESKDTFRGNPKPLYFYENREKFAKYLDKIIYVCVEERPDFQNLAWEREKFQRNQIMRGLTNCNDNDIIIISDLDEIIKGSLIDIITNKTNKYPYVHCELSLYYFYLNNRSARLWVGPCATTFTQLKKHNPQYFRDQRFAPVYLVKNAGWHFSYIGGIAKVNSKIESYSHSELDIPELKNEEAIKKHLCQDCFISDIDSSYPNYVLQNIEWYLENGYICLK